MAAALKNGTVLSYTAELPENKRKILYVDTEQSTYTAQRWQNGYCAWRDYPQTETMKTLNFSS